MKSHTAAAVFLLGQLVFAAAAPAGPLRIVLVANTTIQQDTVLLVRLLPPDAPADLRRRAETVSLGPAPAPGDEQFFSQGTILAALRTAGLSANEFVVPQRIVVRRVADSQTRERLWLTLLDAAATRGITLPAELRSQNLHWAATPDLLAGNSRLEVQSIHVDKLVNQLRLRLRIANAPSTPSFDAWCAWPDAKQLSRNHASGTLLPERAKPTIAAATLVSIRRAATLHLHSENSSATLQVRALQSGDFGELVRVRVVGNGHTLVARVAGPDFLDAAF